jgi:16S rRNA (guanine1516-N2)-methyltransferase
MAERPLIVVLAGAPNLEAAARRLAARLQLPLASMTDAADAGARFALTLAQERLEIRDLSMPRSKPLLVDFVAGSTGYRRVAAGGRRQPIARALGIRAQPPSVLDATAGLAKDAFLLAVLGCAVTAVERSAVLFALVEDGLRRAAESGDKKLLEAIGRLRFVHADAIEFMTRLRGSVDSKVGPGLLDFRSQPPEVIYLDPMYPPSNKSAEVKKEMRLLRALVGDDPDADALLAAAREVATSRVVVKRLRHASPLGPPPSHSVAGTRVRYDVYLVESTLRGDRLADGLSGLKQHPQSDSVSPA